MSGPVLCGDTDAQNGEATCPKRHSRKACSRSQGLKTGSVHAVWPPWAHSGMSGPGTVDWVREVGGSAISLRPSTPCALVSSKADDFTTVVTGQGPAGEYFYRVLPGGGGGVPGLCEATHLFPGFPALSSISRPSSSWKMKAHRTTLCSAPRKWSWVAGLSLFIDIFWVPMPAGSLGSGRHGSTSEGWAPQGGSHIGTKRGPLGGGDSGSLWNLSCMTLNAQKDTFF